MQRQPNCKLQTKAVTRFDIKQNKELGLLGKAGLFRCLVSFMAGSIRHKNLETLTLMLFAGNGFSACGRAGELEQLTKS